MDLPRVKLLVAQFLSENGYKEALYAFERESGVTFDDSTCKKTSELMAILDGYYELTRERVEKQSEKLEFEDGDGDFCNKVLLDIPGLVGGINILAIRMSSSGDLFAGSVQGLLSLLPLKTPLPTDTHNLPLPSETKVHSAGLIAIDVFKIDSGHLLLTGSMDRKCCLLKLTKEALDEPKVTQVFEHHKKFVVKVRWSYSGKYFVTASYDQTVCIYRESKVEQFELVKQMKFKGQVEGITFRKKTDVLIVSVRNDNYLHIVDLTLDEPLEVNKINMNVLGDDHVSFTAMDISCSPDDNFILVSTDQNRLIIYDFTGDQIANFYGSLNDEFSQPRSCWHPSGHYIYSTSQDKCIVVWEVASQSVVTKLEGHTGIVRDLWYCEPLSVLVSCGFDGAVRLWHNGEN